MRGWGRETEQGSSGRVGGDLERSGERWSVRTRGRKKDSVLLGVTFEGRGGPFEDGDGSTTRDGRFTTE